MTKDKVDEEQAENEKINIGSEHLVAPIKLGKLDNVDVRLLMNRLRKFLKKEKQSWIRMWKCLKCANLLITLAIMGINSFQIIINFTNLPPEIVRIFSSCLPVLSSLLISFQDKFGWEEKADVSEECVEFYKKMMKHIEARIRFDEVGAKVADVVEMWNESLVTEMKEIPQAIVPF